MKWLKSLRRFLLFISFILSVAFWGFPRGKCSSPRKFHLTASRFLFECVAGKPNTNLADMQYRASLGFFLRLFFEVEKSLIIKNKKLFLTPRGKNFLIFSATQCISSISVFPYGCNILENGIRSDEIFFARFLTFLGENLATDKKWGATPLKATKQNDKIGFRFSLKPRKEFKNGWNYKSMA